MSCSLKQSHHCTRDFCLFPKLTQLSYSEGSNIAHDMAPNYSWKINYIRPLTTSQGYGWNLTAVDTFWFMCYFSSLIRRI